ncbi:hypothetical protein MF271_08045 [Deinococcus sp. KNUC1210]|uniref:AAA family ATPase n=1 Tax=Deinococcus sp. KNUC1210 TaxID=2917691 RepID=UPI001EF09C48|nr:hypothetical protein [Deinococcus sp. KNUC1210]ULH16515.1 hypothetical protein MF271_08045 [Deinococcus sp. KNUC1210]
MTGPLLYLLGWPGVGKLTVAKELARRTGWRVVDNHFIADPVFHVIGADGSTPLPEGTRQLIGQVGDAIYEAMTRLAPAHLGFVLTKVLMETPEDRDNSSRVEGIAQQRGAVFLPVLLTCDEPGLRARVTSPGRAERLKPRTEAVLDRYFAQYTQLIPEHPHLLTIDTTELHPPQTAELILSHLASLPAAL